MAGPADRKARLERKALLDQLGVSRNGESWTRRVTQPLPLKSGRQVPVAFETRVDAAAVDAFLRTGDADALRQALGPPPAYPHAPELVEHLESLLARGASGHPRHLDALRARLQAECAEPQPLAQAQGRVHARAGPLGAARRRPRRAGSA